MDRLTIENGALRIKISTRGAEMVRVTDASGAERLWSGDASIWAGHAPVLFPVAGSLVGGRYLLGGRAYPLGKHGFARESDFVIEHADREEAVLSLSPREASPAGFPFDYRFRVRYALRGSAADIAFETENRGAAPFYFSCGAHEAYACPEGIEASWVDFPQDENVIQHSELEGPFLTGRTAPVKLCGHRLRLSPALFANDSLVFASLRSREVVLGSDVSARTVRVSFGDFPYLLLWTMLPGGRFLCIEPWHNLPDALHGDHDIARRPGMIKLDPGATRTLTHTVTFA